MLDELSRARRARDAGKDAGIGSGFHNEIHGRQRVDVAHEPHVAVCQLDPESTQLAPVRLATGAPQIIESEECVIGAGLRPRMSQRRTHEPAGAGDQDSHECRMLWLPGDDQKLLTEPSPEPGHPEVRGDDPDRRGEPG